MKIKKPSIAWIADFSLEDHPGGAQRTNRIIIKDGIKRGHEIKEFTLKNYDRSEVADFDLLILNNLHRFQLSMQGEVRWMITTMPYVRYEHDYMADKIMIDIFQNSLLNILLSPMHKERQLKQGYLKESEKNVCQPSPIDTNFFKLPSAKRNEKIIFWAGSMREHKGIENVLAYAKEHPEKEFWFADIDGLKKYKDAVIKEPNCYYLGELTKEEMRDCYQYAQYFIHLPRVHEAFGRTVMEAYLCGCDLIVNDKIGALSYNWDMSDYEKIKGYLNDASNLFWERISELKWR